MCQIFQVNPGVVVPFDKFKLACEHNGDGYGFIINDRNKFEVRKEFDPNGNDPDKIYKLLEDARDCQTALHLRFRTAGNKDVDNNHPYQVLKKDEDGIDLWFMHNGTLQEWKDVNKDYSDSRNLNDVVLKGMFKAAYAKYGEDYLEELWLRHSLRALKNQTSAFTFNDSLGKRLILGSTHSKEFDGWWASNEYSFRENFTRYQSTQQGQSVQSFTQGGKETQLPAKTSNGQVTPNYRSTTTNGSTSGNRGITAPASTSGEKNTYDTLVNGRTWDYQAEVLKTRVIMSTAVQLEAAYLRDVLKDMVNDTGSSPHFKLSPNNALLPTFADLSDIADHRELAKMSLSDLSALLENAPEAGAILVMELINKAYFNNSAYNANNRGTALMIKAPMKDVA